MNPTRVLTLHGERPTLYSRLMLGVFCFLFLLSFFGVCEGYNASHKGNAGPAYLPGDRWTENDGASALLPVRGHTVFGLNVLYQCCSLLRAFWKCRAGLLLLCRSPVVHHLKENSTWDGETKGRHMAHVTRRRLASPVSGYCFLLIMSVNQLASCTAFRLFLIPLLSGLQVTR